MAISLTDSELIIKKYIEDKLWKWKKNKIATEQIKIKTDITTNQMIQ